MESRDYLLSIDDLLTLVALDGAKSQSKDLFTYESANQDIDLCFALDILPIYHPLVSDFEIQDKVVKFYYYGLEVNRIYALLSDQNQMEMVFKQVHKDNVPVGRHTRHHERLCAYKKTSKDFFHPALSWIEKEKIPVDPLILETEDDKEKRAEIDFLLSSQKMNSPSAQKISEGRIPEMFCGRQDKIRSKATARNRRCRLGIPKDEEKN